MAFKATFATSEPMAAEFQDTDSFNADFNIQGGGGPSLPAGGQPGDLLYKKSAIDGDVDWLTPADSAVGGDYRPITSDAISRLIENYSHIYSDTQEHWDSQVGLIAEKNAVYVYTNHSYDGNTPISAIKIGDGTSYLIDMPFLGDDIMTDLRAHIANLSVHVTAQEKQFWNNKVTAIVQQSDPEKLVLTNAVIVLEG